MEQTDAPAAAESPRPMRARPPANEHRSLLDTGLQDFHGVVAESDELGDASMHAMRSARESYDSLLGQPTDLDQHDVRMLEPQALHPSLQEFDAERALQMPAQPETTRPAPQRTRPAPAERRAKQAASRRSYRDVIRLGVALALLLTVCGVFAWEWPRMASFYHSLRTPAASETASGNSAAPSGSKFPDRIEPGAQSQQQSTATQTNPAPNATTAGGVAQRVVLYEEDPPNPEVKRFAGSAIWRTEMISPGAGKPPEMAIRADVEIPERGITMSWSLRRNTDPSLPASHTVEIMFKLPKDFPGGGIANVPGMLMKQGEEARGIPIAGMAVKVTNGYFLIGLSAVEADKDRNVQLLKERPWFDIMLVYNNNRRAILAIEKGAPGEAAFQQAFSTWAKQG
jgi:hypothetical protein